METKKVELLYVWINEYKKLKQIGFNLSNKFKFHYEPDSKTLFRKENPNYVEDFLPKPISSLSAIIGENGTGKTSFNKFLLENFTEGIGRNQVNAIVIYKREGSMILYSHPEITINRFEPNDYKIEGNQMGIEIGSELTFIYHTNFFDPMTYEDNEIWRMEMKGMVNLSTFYLLFNDSENLKNIPTMNLNTANLNDHLRMELQRHVRFIKELKNESLFIKLPQFLIININDTSYNILHDKLRRSEKKKENKSDEETIETMNYLSELDSLFKQLNNNKKIKTDINDFVLNSLKASIWNFIHSHRNYFSINTESYFKIVIETFTRLEYSQENQSLKDFISKFYNNLINNDHLWTAKKILLKQKDFLLGLYEISKFAKSIKGKKIVLDIYDLSSNDYSILLKYIDTYYESFLFLGYNNFYLTHSVDNQTSFSSGEYSILSIFARIHWAVNSLQYKNEFQKNLIIILDEAEMTLHPQWQKEFLSKLFEFVNRILKDYYIQIIITSHSPFLISDLPANYINFLEKADNGTIRIGTLKDNIQTFGQNIHQLFTDSFFMKNGLMGNYASNKISEIIELILEGSKKAFTENQEKIKKTIHLIGEPIIKNKLLQLYEDRLRLENIDMEHRISKLENDFKSLKGNQ